MLTFCILLDYRWIVPLRAEIGSQLELLLLFLMVMQLAQDVVVLIFILDILNVVLLVAIVILLSLRYLGVSPDFF